MIRSKHHPQALPKVKTQTRHHVPPLPTTNRAKTETVGPFALWPPFWAVANCAPNPWRLVGGPSETLLALIGGRGSFLSRSQRMVCLPVGRTLSLRRLMRPGGHVGQTGCRGNGVVQEYIPMRCCFLPLWRLSILALWDAPSLSITSQPSLFQAMQPGSPLPRQAPISP